MSDATTMTPPDVKKEVKPTDVKPRKQPPYHVILLDDDDHTYDYVMEMLGRVFGYDENKAYQMAKEVDLTGRVIVDTTTLERAELKRDQIHAYGSDWRLPRSKGSMSAKLEPAE
ncbi:MAG TPA: ATP-dependent Clp protease adaptor ClpS [Phycisphaerae bacterium]|jgi:ATP-dependent Clp protease adaptor protein ClpS|nr:ATP-dependent Clp protease adaptor ClpS [Phycisphaerae bacterium]HOB74645.1 ATP-dependent Clp protease adaptor ClpS [Phycisphaerae bacterium]HOJ53642.1 ATP-dependent Clp protease adaptor ClpS [Phycisphaerae bacterium]HOL26367.1 ATP-dependent Clp protease adaptor ClpS [Phycisphaerae bacterium]HPP21124.1 ATP-dependent Clp protease adaptor ClpS [Phycisphaerae bacterium]